MLRRMIVAVVSASLAAGALAQDKSDAAKPQPNSPAKAKASAADEAALRAVLKSLAKALHEGNSERIRHAIYASNDTERKMVDAMTAMAVQIAQLYKASAKAFGEEQAKSLTGDVASEMTRIDQAEISINGDTASVRYVSEDSAAGDEPPAAPTTAPAPMVLRKVGGRWQVPMSELSKDTTPEEIEQRLEDLALQTKVIAELSSEIAQGKHKSAEKAAEAWQAKMMQVLTPRKGEEKSDPKKSESGEGKAK